MNRVMDELPDYYEGIKEFQELTRVQSRQLDHLDRAIQQFEDDQFILTSSELAVYRREKMFTILPDRTTETLDFRKRRLLTRMQTKPPFVLEYLKRLFDSLLGMNMHEITLDKLLFEMEVLIEVESISFYSEAEKTLERILPLNILYRIISRMQTNIFLATTLLSGEEITVYPWRSTEIKTTGTISLGSAQQSFEEVSVYPQ